MSRRITTPHKILCITLLLIVFCEPFFVYANTENTKTSQQETSSLDTTSTEKTVIQNEDSPELTPISPNTSDQHINESKEKHDEEEKISEKEVLEKSTIPTPENTPEQDAPTEELPSEILTSTSDNKNIPIIDTLDDKDGSDVAEESPEENPTEKKSSENQVSLLPESSAPTANAEDVLTEQEDLSPSPEEAPSDHLVTDYIDIRINEFLPNPQGSDSGNEFVEFYNYGDRTISLKKWTFEDASGKSIYTFEDITIDEKGYLTLYNKSDFSFALNNTTDTLTLKNPHGEIIATHTYTSQKEDYSWNFDDTYYAAAPTPNILNNPNPEKIVYPHLTISEILPNPSGDESLGEYIEIYNPTTQSVSLLGWTLKDASKTGSYTFDTEIFIEPLSYFVIYRSDYTFALNNSGDETVSLLMPNTSVSDHYSYAETTEDHSYSWDGTHFTLTSILTPGSQNAFPPPPEIQNFLPLMLNEILPNPSGDESLGEYIEIYNPHDTPQNLRQWTLRDASKTGSYTFSDDTIIPAHSYYTIYRSTFSFALNNSGSETISLIDPNGTLVDDIMYTSAKEDASFGRDDTIWRWSKSLTPGTENIFGEQLFIKDIDVDQKIYTNVKALFEMIAPKHISPDTLSFRWDFGDGHRSYLQSTSHTFTDPGIYTIEARLSNDIESVSTFFTITVADYPERDAEIVAIMPNPDGKDYDTEYIIIKNNDDSGLNISRWSIATGKDKDHLVNHPVREHIIISHDTTKKIRSHHSAISLPNKGGYIELRAPDGKVIDSIKYELPENQKSIPKDALYTKIDGSWQWIIPPQKQKISPKLAKSDVEKILTYARTNTYSKKSHAIPLISKETEIASQEQSSIAPLIHALNRILTSLYIQTTSSKKSYPHSYQIPQHSADAIFCTKIDQKFSFSPSLDTQICTTQ